MKKLLLLLPLLLIGATPAPKAADVAQPEKPKKYFLVEEDVLQAVMQYMATKPYQETFQLIPALQQATKPFVKEDACKAK